MIVEARRDVISLRGDLTEDQWPAVQAAAKMLLDEHPQGIIIDCSGITEITEAGAKTFHDAIKYIQRYDARIIVAGLSEEAQKVIRSVRAVMSQLPTAPTVEAARASLGLDDMVTKGPGKGLSAFVVLLVGDWERAAHIACEIADRKRDEVHLVEVLKVPRSMPLATPLPEAEALARRQLDDSEKIAKSCRLSSVRHVERVRSIAEGIQRVLTTLNPATIVICVAKEDEEAHEIIQLMPGLLEDPPCEIIYVRKPVRA
jgi:anti-anti-sigma regulatory factor